MTNSVKPVARVVVTPIAPQHRTSIHRQDLPGLRQRARELQDGIEDEEIAARSTATLLITASTPDEVETLARRIHSVSARAAAPFVSVCAGALPAEPSMLRKRCSALLDTASGGSLLMTHIEEAPTIAQGVVIEFIAELQSGRAQRAAARLIAGTTVCLFDRVALGTFSERLFYRLNTLHIVVGTDAAAASVRL